MKRFKLGLLFLTLSYAFVTCTTPSETPPATIIGKWNILSVDSNISEISAAPQSSSKNISKDSIFIQFYSTLDFATNSDLSLSKLQISPSFTKTGTYQFFKDGQEDKIVLIFYDDELQGDVGLIFQIKNINSNNPVLYMDTQDYIQSLTESANEKEFTIEQSLINFSNRINSASFSLNCQK
ncbi:hypothetical protein SAMN06298216_3192 [Spirosomataceae bacterium TFI 002]|nr:hypothetical protein SAMN06298216_3192 [Spirosomataceae bacterium TFI 002]